MTHAVIPDEGPRPVDIRLLGAQAVVQVADAFAQTGEQSRKSRAAARSRRGHRRLRADNGAHGAHISTQHPVFAHLPAVLLVTCRRTMQNRLNLGWRASFAGRLSVAPKTESARRPQLARAARRRVSGLSGGALDYFGQRTRGVGSKGAGSAAEPRLPWRYVRYGGAMVEKGPAATSTSVCGCGQVTPVDPDLSGCAPRTKTR